MNKQYLTNLFNYQVMILLMMWLLIVLRLNISYGNEYFLQLLFFSSFVNFIKSLFYLQYKYRNL